MPIEQFTCHDCGTVQEVDTSHAGVHQCENCSAVLIFVDYW